MSERLRKTLNECGILIDGLSQRDDGCSQRASFDQLKSLLDKILHKRSRLIAGNLPYRNLNYPAREPSTAATVVPAYQGGSTALVVPEDLKGSQEKSVDKEIAELARSLNWSPVEIYEYVKNNIETEWYWGSMKGAEETLRQKSGNDADQAALLVALLRASGFPSRYVRGTIEFFPGIEKVKNLTGIDDPNGIAAFFQKSGIPFQPVISGGRIVNFQVEHIWVESRIPYSNYRGALIDEHGKTWLGLDTTIKVNNYQYSGQYDIAGNLSMAGLRDEYLTSNDLREPLLFIKDRIQSFLQDRPELSYAGFLRKRTLPTEEMKILPASLQFNPKRITNEYTSLPEELQHRIRVTATAKNNVELLSITLNARDVSSRKVELIYEPESIEDQQIINSFGGLDNTPPYLIRLRPVIRVDDERIIVARDGLPMGEDFQLMIDLISPGSGGTESFKGTHVAGNLSVLGIVAQKSIMPAVMAAEEMDAAELLYEETINYINRWNRAEDELAALLHLNVVRPTPAVVVIGGVVDVAYLLDTPHSCEGKGVYLDAGLRTINVQPASGENSRQKLFMQLAALQGSVLENKIFEDDFHVDSVSAAKVAQIAVQQTVPLLTINKDNIADILSGLPFDENIKQDITNSVHQNYTVRIPDREIIWQDWTGIGYIKENQETGEAGYMLSGMIAGGMTAWATDKWPGDTALKLANPYSEVPAYNPTGNIFIEKISASDLQKGTVGRQLTAPLQVKVNTIDMNNGAKHPVPRKEVTFTVKKGGGTFSDGSTSKTVKTDINGIAGVNFILGQKTSDNPVYILTDGAKYAQQTGENIVDAALAGGTNIKKPFTTWGLPDTPKNLVKTYGNNFHGPILSYAGFLSALVADQYGNPVSNVEVTFSVLPAIDKSSCSNKNKDQRQAVLIDENDSCINRLATAEQCSTIKSVQTVISSSKGAAIGVILGGIPEGQYPFEAKGGGLSTAFTMYTTAFGACAPSDDPSLNFNVSYVYPADEYGNNINAGKVSRKIPVQARVSALKENETDFTGTFCDPQITCTKVAGNRIYDVTTDFRSSSVTFSGQPGIDAGGGFFGAEYMLAKGINNIVINGSATIQARRTDVCPACRTAPRDISGSKAVVMQVFGVEIAVDPIPAIVVDAKGYAGIDCRIGYTIMPAEYKANNAVVFVYKNGQVIAAIPTEKQGSGFATISAGFELDSNSIYEAEVILNYGSSVEIRSEKIPMVVFDMHGGLADLKRSYHHSTFDNFIPALPPYVDDHKILNFNLPKDSAVSLMIVDSNGQEKGTAVGSTNLAAGDYSFLIDYDTVSRAGINTNESRLYYLRLAVRPNDGSARYETIYKGMLTERHDGKKIPGQLIVHDVMIQDGSLHLTRNDLSLKGRGPQLNFTRSYHNLGEALSREFLPFGPGWSHNLDSKIRPLMYMPLQTGSVPDWVADLRGKFFPAGSDTPPQDSLTVVQANGTTFKKQGGVWYSERGMHGTLEETSATFIYTSKDGTRYTYGRSTIKPMPVQSIQDRNGNAMTFTYDLYNQKDRLIAVKDAVGRELTFTYDNALLSRLVKVSGPDGVELLFSYDLRGNLQSVRRCDRVETYAYEAEKGIVGGNDNLVSIADSNGNVFSYQYHTFSELTSYDAVLGLKPQDVVKTVTYPDQAKAEFHYDFLNRSRTVKDLRGNDTGYTLNPSGNPLRIEEPLGRVTKMTWSIDEGKNDNVMTSKTNSRGYRTSYEYDVRGNITRETDHAGNSIGTVWNQKYSLPETRTDRNGVARSWQYDASTGNLLSSTDGDGKVTRYGYYDTGEMKSMVDPRGYETAYEYDLYGNPSKVTSAEGSVTQYLHDVRGRKQAQKDPNGNTTNYTYSDLDYLTRADHPAVPQGSLASGYSTTQLYTHDALGNLVTETNRNNLKLTYAYTKRNQVESVTRSTGGTKSYAYDPNGNLTMETDWRGRIIRHDYNPLNQRIRTTDRLLYTMSMEHDTEGNLTSSTDNEGRVTTCAYDYLNRRTDIWQSALADQERGHIVNTYYAEADPKTNLKTVTDQENNATTFEYNGRYLKSRRINALGKAFQWDYDDSGNLIKETDEENNYTTYAYDRQNRRTSMVRMGNVVTGYGYDPNGNQTQINDPRGNLIVTDYDAWNRPYRVTDPDSYATRHEFDGESNKVLTRDGNDHLRTWRRDAQGRVTEAVDAEGHATRHEYDANDNVTSTTEANGTVTATAYDDEDRPSTTTETTSDAVSRTKSILSRDKVGNPLQANDYNGNVTTTTYNGLNLPQSVCDPKGKCLRMSYYKTGKVKTVTNKRGFAASHLYDALNREVKVTDARNQTIDTSYDNVGNVRTIKDKRRIIRENAYDPLYRLTQVVKDGVQLVTNEYDGNGNLSAVIDANGNRVENQYNKRNLRTVTAYVTDGTSETQSYDGVGNLLTHTNEEGQTTTYTYDRENRRTSETFAGEKTLKAYDGMGDLIAVTRPLGNIRKMTYDGFRRLASAVDDASGLPLTSRYQYDPNNNLVAEFDPRGCRTSFFYDELNRKIQQSQSVYITRFDYDEENNLTSMRDANGQITGHTYDELNRLITSNYSEQAITRGYDPNNNLTMVTENKTQAGITDTTVNAYDNFDRLSSSSQRGLIVEYAHDPNGNRTRVATAAAATDYTYDGKNRIRTAVSGGRTTAYTYTPAGKKDTITYPNGTSVKYAYHATNRIKTIEHRAGTSLISGYFYIYDPNGNRTEQTETQGGVTETTNYTYDTLDRLTEWMISNKTRSTYTYDGYNRKTEIISNLNPGTLVKQQTYDYDETNRLTRTTDSVSGKIIGYAYDNNGNTIRKTDSLLPDQETTFTYDSRNQLTQTKSGPPGSEAILGKYDYNHAGWRVRHLNSDRGNIDYYYDGKSVIEERNASDNSLLAHYNYADRLLSLQTSTSTQYYHHDVLGSTVNLTDEAGNPQISYLLDPWGHIRNQIGSSINRRIFTGHEQDTNTNLIYFGARYYDPDTGRFITQDPYLGEPSTPPSLHRYLYAYSNPTVYVDLEGYFVEEIAVEMAQQQVMNAAVASGGAALSPRQKANKVAAAALERGINNAVENAKELISGERSFKDVIFKPLFDYSAIKDKTIEQIGITEENAKYYWQKAKGLAGINITTESLDGKENQVKLPVYVPTKIDKKLPGRQTVDAAVYTPPSISTALDKTLPPSQGVDIDKLIPGYTGDNDESRLFRDPLLVVDLVADKTRKLDKRIPKQITVLGSARDTRQTVVDWPGHNVLSIDPSQWSAKKNIKWLDSAIRRGDEIYLGTDVEKHESLLRSLPTRPFSGFIDLEVPYLKWKGYKQQGDYMVSGRQ